MVLKTPDDLMMTRISRNEHLAQKHSKKIPAGVRLLRHMEVSLNTANDLIWLTLRIGDTIFQVDVNKIFITESTLFGVSPNMSYVFMYRIKDMYLYVIVIRK